MRGDVTIGRTNSQRQRAPRRIEHEQPKPVPADRVAAFASRCLDRELRGLETLRSAAADRPPDTDSVHKMRTATRRVRVLLRLFDDLLPPDTAALAKEFRWFARVLGKVRDLDVCHAKLPGYVDAIRGGKRQQFAAYELHLRRERNAARRNLAPFLQGERVVNLINTREQLLRALSRHDLPTATALMRERVPHYVEAAAGRVLKRGRKIDAGSRPEKLHRLRIQAKRFRYELEFFSEVYPVPLRKTARAAKRLQDLLGEYQDACTACERLQEYASSLAAHGVTDQQLHELDQLRRSQAGTADAVRAKFPKQWRRFEKAVVHDWHEVLAAS